MSGEKNLDKLIASMQPVLHPDVYVFATVSGPVPTGTQPIMTFAENAGTTLIVTRDSADKSGLKHAFPCRMITLNIHSSLDAVGFLARITSRLATLEMGVNPVSAFYHDHLFVPEDRASDAMSALNEMTARSA